MMIIDKLVFKKITSRLFMSNMLHLTKQKIEKQDFSIFLRDLASTLNINLKHMIEDNIKIEEKPKTKNHNKKKKVVVKKKDLIIQQQNLKREKMLIENDMKKIDFLFETMDHNNPFLPIQKLSTLEGKTEWKLKLLKEFWKDKKKYMNYIIILYYEIKEQEQEKDNEIVKKIEKTLSNYECKAFMMKELGHMLPPLNNWDRSIKKFDDWQEKTIHLIKDKQNIIVKAPTSSGKSFIAMAAGIIHKKVLYICPAKPVVYQIGSHFTHMGYKVHFLVDNLSHYSYDSGTNIFIGTPKEVETYIVKVGVNFDYAVYDEIHNLNKDDDGDSYENLTKLIQCPFLALSATIKNIDHLHSYFHKIYKKQIHLIEYNKRFINHQRWIWKKKLVKLHPLCSYDTIESLNDNLPFTPNDCATLWECIQDVFEDLDDEYDILDDCSPDECFTEDKLIGLDDCKIYEGFLKSKLREWNNDYPNEVQKVFDHFKSDALMEETDKNDLVDFIKSAKQNDMFPMIMFHTNELVCKDIFYQLYDYLNKKELEEYPYHYEILEKKEELYQAFKTKRETFKDGIKVKSSNAEFEIKDKMNTFEKKEKNNYIDNVQKFYIQKINQINNSEIDSKIKSNQLKNIKQELNQFLESPDFCHQDIFKKHKKFIFTNSSEPMSADTIRSVRREILKTLGIKIPYESPLFQLLKRGIGIYIENMPDEYNWILQKLLSKKEIGIVISDKTLCLGIDLPVRSSCFLGMNHPNFTKDDYLQMSGRAGRRGMDTKGNIIFYGNIDYLSLMKSDLPEITGSTNPINSNYKVLNKDSIFENILNPERKNIIIENYQNSNEKKLIWNLRKYRGISEFSSTLLKLEKEIFMKHDSDKEIYLLSKIEVLINQNDNLLEEFKMKKIINENKVELIKEYIDVVINIYNSLNKDKYLILRKTLKNLFDIFNKILFNYII
tara:strand:+ start:2511 stop:5339 length:2829 start_codon:yes stop_codon:yes gene_type:complete